MDFKIAETGKIEELTLNDPKTNCCWLSDLMGGCDDITDVDDDGNNIVTADVFEWWKTLVTEWQFADERLFEVRENLNWDTDNIEKFDAYICDAVANQNGIEDHPQLLMSALDEWEADHKN